MDSDHHSKSEFPSRPMCRDFASWQAYARLVHVALRPLCGRPVKLCQPYTCASGVLQLRVLTDLAGWSAIPIPGSFWPSSHQKCLPTILCKPSSMRLS
eukprot:5629666-Amphidinium_carterae.1